VFVHRSCLSKWLILPAQQRQGGMETGWVSSVCGSVWGPKGSMEPEVMVGRVGGGEGQGSNPWREGETVLQRVCVKRVQCVWGMCGVSTCGGSSVCGRVGRRCERWGGRPGRLSWFGEEIKCAQCLVVQQV